MEIEKIVREVFHSLEGNHFGTLGNRIFPCGRNPLSALRQVTTPILLFEGSHWRLSLDTGGGICPSSRRRFG